MKRFMNMLLAFFLTISTISPTIRIHATADTQSNVALHKPVTVSSTFPGKPWTKDKVTDGLIDATTTKNSRWSSKRLGTSTTKPEEYDANKQQWVMIDLQQPTQISQINIYWEGAYATSYKLQTSDDGKTFTDLATISNGNQGWKKHSDFQPVTARYVRVLCLQARNDNWGYSMFEVEVYGSPVLNQASDVISMIENKAPTISPDGTRVLLPAVPEGYEVSLYGSDNQQVVALDQTLIQPLQDLNVHVMYQVTNKQNPKDVATSTVDATMKVCGRYQKEAKDNEKPNVVPGLREWKGTQGNYQFSTTSNIVIADESLHPEAQMIQQYFKTLLNTSISVRVGTPVSGDIYLVKDASLKEVGKEGYTLAIEDFITIHAATYKGMIYGATSITQILYQNQDTLTIPKGYAKDYPKYAVRAGMIDVGRMYIPLEYLEELTIYMSWFKMNEIHVHINDYWNQSGYSAFRLESETYPMINAKDGYYTKQEYKQYQKDMKAFGVDVITEIDTPYHAESFRNVPGIRMLPGKKGYLDITTKEAFDANRVIMERLFDEYLDGEDPVIQSQNFHIGTDEYAKTYGNQMRQWTDHFANYVNQKGYQTRAWASLGKNGFQGSAPVTSEITMNLWAPYWADVKETYQSGYDVINTYGGWLYIVPAGNAGYPDRLNTQRVYEKFEVNDFKSGRNPNGEAIMPFAHPQTKGAEFAIWNDMTSFKTGFSWFDIFDRMKDAVSVVSEKTWYGEREEDQSYAQFRSRIDVLQDVTPNANPGRYVSSVGDVIADYDFSNVTDTLVDQTENQYDAQVYHPQMNAKGLMLDGTSYLSLPMKSIGYPYSVRMDITFDEYTTDSILFHGKEGSLYINETGSIFYQRGAYTFTFDQKLQPKKAYTLIFTCDEKAVTLYINGRKAGIGKLTEPTIAQKAQQSSTFVLPVEEVGKGVKGTLSALTLYKHALSQEEVYQLLEYQPQANLALQKQTQVSGLEVNDGRFTSDLAVDGLVNKDSRVSFAKNQDEQWLLIDLNDTYEVATFVIQFESAVGKYDIQVSDNGTDFTTIYTRNDPLITTATPRVDRITVDPISCRYVKYVQKERWKHSGNNRYYSGSIYEFEVYQSANKELTDALTQLQEALSHYQVGMKNGQLNEQYYQALMENIKTWQALAQDPTLTKEALEDAKTAIFKEIKQMESHVCYVKQEAIDAYEQAIVYKRSEYTKASFEQYQIDLRKIKEQLDQCQNYKDVNACLEALTNAQSKLVRVNQDVLLVAIQQGEAIDVTLYQHTETFEKALQDAKAESLEPTTQETINQKALALQNEIANLVLKPANYKAVDDAVAHANALKREDYVDFSKVEAALQAVKRGYDITRQQEVNQMAQNIEQAIDDLVLMTIVPIEMSATLTDQISMNIYVQVSEKTLQDNGAYVEFLMQDQEQLVTRKIMVKDFMKQHNRYVVSMPLYARMMSNDVTMRVFSTKENGEVSEDASYTYSIVSYANAVLSSAATTKAERDVIEAMLNYGAMAQVYFRYNTEHLANQAVQNKDYQTITASSLQSYQGVITDQASGVRYGATNLRLVSQTAMRHHFIVDSSQQDHLEYYLVKDGKKTSLTPTYVASNQAYVEVEHIYVQDYHKPIVVEVKNTLTQEITTVRYSVFSYAYAILTKENSSKVMQDVVKALVDYNQKACIYQMEKAQ